MSPKGHTTSPSESTTSPTGLACWDGMISTGVVCAGGVLPRVMPLTSDLAPVGDARLLELCQQQAALAAAAGECANGAYSAAANWRVSPTLCSLTCCPQTDPAGLCRQHATDDDACRADPLCRWTSDGCALGQATATPTLVRALQGTRDGCEEDDDSSSGCMVWIVLWLLTLCLLLALLAATLMKNKKSKEGEKNNTGFNQEQQELQDVQDPDMSLSKSHIRFKNMDDTEKTSDV